MNCPDCGTQCVKHWLYYVEHGARKRYAQYMCLKCENIFSKFHKGYSQTIRNKVTSDKP
jgi:hypothetical protein